MAQKADLIYEFGRFQLHASQRVLTHAHNGEPVALRPRSFDTLLALVENRDRILDKDELMKIIWPGSFVEEGNLTQHIFVLRKILGDDQNGNRFIQTLPRRGYRFVAKVKEIDAATVDDGFAGTAHPQSDYWTRESPFRSLQVFEPEDAWLFFGRDAETDELLARLRRSPRLVMVGNSGSGKSSLVRAGVVAALRAGRLHHEGLPVDNWRIAVFRPSGAPFDYLAEALPAQLAPELSLTERAEFIACCRKTLPAGGDELRNVISALASAVEEKPESAHILLVADQFEEIFTLTTNRQTRERYIDALLRASRLNGAGAVTVRVVLVLRADFYAHCLEHAELSRCLEANLYNVPRMSHEQLRETIEKRLALAGAHAEPGLIDSLLEDVGAEPGDLALLEHALGQLWEKCGGCGGPSRTLTNQAYAEIGRLRGALGRHADAVYAGLGDETQKPLAKKIFLELVHLGEGAQDTRRRVRKADLLSLGGARDEEEMERLLGRLVSGRLITTGGEGQETFVEVSHEALIREWPALREWLTQNREELRLGRRLHLTAQEWEGLDQDAGALLQGARLAQAEEWLGKHEDAPILLRQFVEASVGARAAAEQKERETQERELAQQTAAAVMARRSAARLRWFLYALAAALLVAVGAAWFAYHEQVIQKSRALAAQSGELLQRDRGQALDLAIRSWEIAKTDEAHLAVAKAFPQPLAVLQHEDTVNLAIFSPDGQRILSASPDHTARLWDAGEGRLLATLAHDGAVNHAVFSPDGRRIATASDDKTARIWNTDDGRLLLTLKGHSDRVFEAEFSPDGQRIVTTSWDTTARVWNARDGGLLFTLQGHTAMTLVAAFSPDGERIVTGSYDNTARVWNSADGRLLATLHEHSGAIQYVAFSPDGQRIVTTSTDNTARVWSSADYRLLATLQHHGLVERAEFSRDGQRIVTAGYDNAARVWTVDGRLLLTLPHDGPVQHVEFSPDGQRIATASMDQMARVWNSADGRLLAIFQGHTGAVYHVTFSPSGDRLVTAGADHTVRLWSNLAGRSRAILKHESTVYSASFSTDGERIVTACGDKTARVRNAADGRLLVTLQGHKDGVFQAQFSPDGRQIVTASLDKTARVWNSADGRLRATLQGHMDMVTSAGFSPDGEHILTASWDKTARVWNVADGRLLFTLQGHSDKLSGAQFSPDGQRIVTVSRDKTGRVWSAADGRLLFPLQGHTGRVWPAVFSPDGQRILTGSWDKTARVWNAADGRLLFTLQGHSSRLSGAQFSSDGQRIVTSSYDHTARIWNRADGRLLFTLRADIEVCPGIQGVPAGVAPKFSPDGQRVVTAGSCDNTVRLWSSADGHLLATLQGHSYALYDVEFSRDGRHLVTASADETARVWQLLTLDDIERILAK